MCVCVLMYVCVGVYCMCITPHVCLAYTKSKVLECAYICSAYTYVVCIHVDMCMGSITFVCTLMYANVVASATDYNP